MVGNAYSAPSTLLHETCKQKVQIFTISQYVIYMNEIYKWDDTHPFELVERVAEHDRPPPQRIQDSVALQHILLEGFLPGTRRGHHETCRDLVRPQGPSYMRWKVGERGIYIERDLSDGV